MDEARVQNTLLGWIIPLAISVSILLRREKDLRQKLFILFSGNITLYYLFSFLYAWQGEPWFERVALCVAVLIPQGGLRFFRAFSTGARGMGRLGGVAAILGVVLLAAILYPTALRPAVGPAVLAYVAGFMLVAILNLNVQAKQAATRVDAARIRYLVTFGLLTLAFQVVERLDNIFELDMLPIGLTTTIIYLYIISQTIVLYRILDLYEMMGRFAVLFLMGVALAAIYTGLVVWIGKGFSINAFLASLIILILFNPLRDLVERKIADFFLRERHILEQDVGDLRRRLSHVIDVEVLVGVLMDGLERSKRLTHASLYLIDPHGRGFDLKASVGPAPKITRVEVAVERMHLKPFASDGVLVATSLEAQRERLLQAGMRDQAQKAGETLDLLEGMLVDVLLEIQGEKQVFGLLSVRDERRKDPFSPEDVDLLRGLTGQVAVTVENSQIYQQTKERDRLAALGRMAAGLAHEIRNPLGSIKGAAQVVEEMAKDGTARASDNELMGVIVEEVDRLDRVVYDFLTYARPSSQRVQVLNINEILERTVQVFETRRGGDMSVNLHLDDALPGVQADGERLHQVFLNLMLNAEQAMDGQSSPTLDIATRVRIDKSMEEASAQSDSPRELVAVSFSDNGPGLPPETQENIFIPFFTTKEKGSGLGLSIGLRIIRDAGGDIEVRSQVGQGSTFTVVLPATSK
jgi:nitrogen-specific signal transduction histidine kinase